VSELDGLWTVERVGGLLPPMIGITKRIEGDRGVTIAGALRLPVDVRGRELHYRGLLTGLVDVLEPDGDAYRGETLYRGRRLGRFRLTREQ
jgi:hypothetical protein